MNLVAITLLILDVDGVLTDGRIAAGPNGSWTKAFCVQDGCALKLWRRAGGRIAWLSGRTDEITERRARELDIEMVQTGVSDKLAGYTGILSAVGIDDSAVAYVGDDLPDLGPMSRAGFPVAVANAHPLVKRASMYVTRQAGGSGAAAEVVELLLRKQDRWSRAMPASP